MLIYSLAIFALSFSAYALHILWKEWNSWDEIPKGLDYIPPPDNVESLDNARLLRHIKELKKTRKK